MNHALEYRRLRTDRRDGAVVYDPPVERWVELATANQRHLQRMEFDLQGISAAELRQRARQELWTCAQDYMASYAPMVTRDGPIVMSGHQPEFFHPGVWAKNFIAQVLADRIQGTAVHVLIDNDLVRQTAIRLPTGSAAEPRVVVEPYDHLETPEPYEFRRAAKRDLVATFADRVERRLEGILSEPPLVTCWWPDVMAAVNKEVPFAQAISRARHRMELSWGRSSVEVPLSTLCQGLAFSQFLADLLLRGRAVRDAVNGRLREYRQVHKLRSPAQPLPDLRQQDDWVESPFWVWSQNAPMRKALWWTREQGQLILGQPGVPCWTFDTSLPSSPSLGEQLRDLQAQGVCFRPRALTNSMFLRLFVSDVFVHGIGGGKYDQITDLLMRDLYGVEPPRFTVCSQTTWLPVPFTQIGQQEISEKKQQRRAMYFHPERFLDAERVRDPQVSSWVARKREALRPCQTVADRRQRHREVSAANAVLREFLQEKPEELHRQLMSLLSQQAVSKVWSSREWPAAVFPESFLRQRLLDLDLPAP